MDKIQVQTQCGTLEGVREGRLYTFKGIPYAKAERFQKPESYTWEGTYVCDTFGKKAMQVYDTPMFDGKVQTRDEFDEDCLNLNIYTPSVEGSLPVVIYIHGGAFQNGSNQGRDGAYMIRDHQFIYVAVNYRLGALGYLYLGELLGKEYASTGNLGTLDQLAAVKWIYENIKVFGGDPEKITIIGESAGAKSIAALLTLPDMKKYCAQACLASGAYQSIRDIHTAQTITDRFMEIAKAHHPQLKPEDLLTMSPDDIIEIQKELCSGPGSTCIFGPVSDGVNIPFGWLDQMHKGNYWKGKAIVGSCLHELVFHKLMDKDFVAHAPQIAEELFGTNADIAISDFEALSKDVQETDEKKKNDILADIWVRILSDYMYRTYSARLAQLLYKNGSDVWYYSMEFGRAVHCLDQGMAFENDEKPMFMFGKVFEKDIDELGQCIYESYVRFFEHGDPNGEGIPYWPKFSDEEQKKIVWNMPVEVKPVLPEDTLDHFPDHVYQL